MRTGRVRKSALTLAPLAMALAVPAQATAARLEDLSANTPVRSDRSQPVADQPIRMAAEGDSWLCKYFPKYCGDENSPGGLPGHAAPDSGESESSRGGSDSYEPPAQPSAPAPASPAQPAPPPAEPPKEPQ